MTDLTEKIEKYTDGLFEDLGPTELSEERKADIFARVEERLQKVIISEAQRELPLKQRDILNKALEQQDYVVVSGMLNLSEERKARLENKIEHELNQLRSVIRKEQRYVRES